MIAKDLKYISCQFLRGRDLFRKPIISINPAESPVVERLDTSTARPASELSEASEAPLGPSKEPVITHSMIGFSAFRKLLRPLKWPLSAHLEWIVATPRASILVHPEQDLAAPVGALFLGR